MTYTLNIRFLIKLLVVAAILVGAVYYWHGRQADKQVALFLHLADTGKTEGRPEEEARNLARYLALRPADAEARERLGRLMYERARRPAEAFEAFLVLE